MSDSIAKIRALIVVYIKNRKVRRGEIVPLLPIHTDLETAHGHKADEIHAAVKSMVEGGEITMVGPLIRVLADFVPAPSSSDVREAIKDYLRKKRIKKGDAFNHAMLSFALQPGFKADEVQRELNDLGQAGWFENGSGAFLKLTEVGFLSL